MNSDNLVGITLGNRYDMLEKIGTGGMATVYKAKDTLLNRYVAIKILRDSLEGEEQVVSNFIKVPHSPLKDEPLCHKLQSRRED